MEGGASFGPGAGGRGVGCGRGLAVAAGSAPFGCGAGGRALGVCAAADMFSFLNLKKKKKIILF